MRAERGQASVEWVALVALLALLLGGLLATTKAVEGGRSAPRWRTASPAR